ncbi:hypothetical protein B566_EDAN012963 [Ephemera danica]|nr:hypothetical protein B566_EDAN012963 [Ephemera danica]
MPWGLGEPDLGPEAASDCCEVEETLSPAGSSLVGTWSKSLSCSTFHPSSCNEFEKLMCLQLTCISMEQDSSEGTICMERCEVLLPLLDVLLTNRGRAVAPSVESGLLSLLFPVSSSNG